MKKEEKAIQETIAAINKGYHGNVSVKGVESIPGGEDNIISTGITELDNALGTGGIRKGSIVEIFGPDGVGKTSVALHLAKKHQDKGMAVLYIDTEKTLTKERIKQTGINEDSFYLLDADNLEEALDACTFAASSFGVIIIDSITGLPTKAQRDGDIGDSNVGVRQRILSDAFPVLVPILSKSGCTLIFTNQIRQRVGVMFGNPEISTGGRAPKYYATLRIDLRILESIKDNGEIAGIRVRAKTVKNKISAPFREATFDIFFGKGIKTE